METGGNFELTGLPDALDPHWLAERVRGIVTAPEPFLAILRQACPDLQVWDRVILWRRGPCTIQEPEEFVLRRLGVSDVSHLERLTPDLSWISVTWGGPAGLAASRMCWGAFDGDRLASVACSFFVGERYEDVGVVTEHPWRGKGLAAAAAARLCADILERGRWPSWSTSTDNAASLRVAGKMGFKRHRLDRLYAVGVPIPAP
jgi:GNAT superfamily N-acetyltransferase